MPNHIQNKLQVTGKESDVQEVMNFISSKDEEDNAMPIDFNKITPMPEELNVVSGSNGELAHELLFGTKKEKFLSFDHSYNQRRFAQMSVERQREAVELALKYQHNFVTYGATTWYDWCNENWGTKWNAYSQNDERNTPDTVYFQTAWSSPVNLIKKLSGIFPAVSLHLDYADEDSGSNTGRYIFQAGKVAHCETPESQSKEGYDIYFELNPDRLEEYQLVDGKYQYLETED